MNSRDPKNFNLPKLLTEREAAEYLGIGHGWLSVKRMQGQIQFATIGKRVRYLQKHLDQFLESLPKDGNGKVYLIAAKEVSRVKIGYSEQPKMRLNSLRTFSPVKLKMLAVMPGTMFDEYRLHKKYESKRFHGEWFEDCPEIRAEFGL